MKSTLLKNSFVIALGTAVSRVFGLVRDILLASVLAAGVQADAFVIAFRLPNLFRRLFAEGAFAAGFVPVYAGLEEDRRKEFASVVLSFVSIILFLLTIVAEIFMEQLVFLLAGGFEANQEKFALAVLCSRIAFPYLIFMFLTALYSALLNVAGRFVSSSLVPILLNVVLILAALFIWQENRTPEAAVILSWGVAVAGIVQTLMMMVAASRAGIKVLPKKMSLTPAIKNFFRLIVPALAAGGVVQLNIIIGTRIASGEAGAVAKLYYAERLYQLPLAVIGIAIGVALLPALAQLVEDSQRARLALGRALEGAMLLTLPASAALIIMAEPIIAALFEYGAFDETLRIQVAQILAAFALGLPAFVLQRILSSAFFAHQDTKAPLYAAILALIVNVVLALWWFPFLGATAIALATAAAAWVNGLVLWQRARARNWVAGPAFYKKILAQSAVSGLMALSLYSIQALYPLPLDSLARIVYVALLVLVGLVIYFAICHIVGLVKINQLKKEFYAAE